MYPSDTTVFSNEFGHEKILYTSSFPINRENSVTSGISLHLTNDKNETAFTLSMTVKEAKEVVSALRKKIENYEKDVGYIVSVHDATPAKDVKLNTEYLSIHTNPFVWINEDTLLTGYPTYKYINITREELKACSVHITITGLIKINKPDGNLLVTVKELDDSVKQMYFRVRYFINNEKWPENQVTEVSDRVSKIRQADLSFSEVERAVFDQRGYFPMNFNGGDCLIVDYDNIIDIDDPIYRKSLKAEVNPDNKSITVLGATNTLLFSATSNTPIQDTQRLNIFFQSGTWIEGDIEEHP